MRVDHSVSLRQTKVDLREKRLMSLRTSVEKVYFIVPANGAVVFKCGQNKVRHQTSHEVSAAGQYTGTTGIVAVLHASTASSSA